MRTRLLVVFLCILFFSLAASSQTTEFVYQGQLQNSSAAANGNFDFEFLLFDQLSGGAQVGSTLTQNGVPVTNGIFSVRLDFGSNYPGAQRFLEIHVRQTGGGAFTPLMPRQPVSNTPYSVKSLDADTATNATQLGGVAANQYTLTNDPRLSDGRSPTAGSANYIQNTATQQAKANFNIDGNGLIGGSLGIGTSKPQSPLAVQTVSGAYGMTHTDGTVTVGSYVGGGGGWLGTRSNHPLYFFANNSDPLMTLTTLGFFGIGAFTPQASLHVRGTQSWFQGRSYQLAPAAGQGVAVGFEPNSAGYLFAYDYAANTPQNLSLNSPGGNVGIGTITPTDRLTVQTASNSYGIVHTDGIVTVGSYIGAGSGTFGGWLGTRSNHPLFFYTGGGSPQMTVATSGNVGVGTITPNAKLQVAGNITQGASDYGVVKAMALVKDDNTVVQCYNSQVAGAVVNTPPCGIVVTFEVATGDYLIDFGFPVSTRYFSVTPRTLTNGASAPIDVTATVQGSANVNQIRAYLRSSLGDKSGFFIFVY